MVCKNCYYNNESDSKFCVKCGAELQPEVVVQNTSNNNTQNNSNNMNNTNNVNYGNQYNETVNYSPASAIIALIVSMLCCSNIIGLVFSILALVEGGKINPAVLSGNIGAAKASLEQYKKWTKYAWISTVIWVVAIILIYVLYFVFVFGIAILTSEY